MAGKLTIPRAKTASTLPKAKATLTIPHSSGKTHSSKNEVDETETTAKKITSPRSPERVRQSDPEPEEETETRTSTKAEAAETKSAKEEETVAKVEIKKSAKDWVSVTVYNDIEPAPIVGAFNVGHELGITKMSAKASYKVPRYVAEVLVDAKKGLIIPS